MGMTTLSAFNRFTSSLGEQEQLMPVFFIGHGSPMNGYHYQLAGELYAPGKKGVLIFGSGKVR